MEVEKKVCPKCSSENYKVLDTRWILGFKSYMCEACLHMEQAPDDAKAQATEPEVSQTDNDNGTYTRIYKFADPRQAHATDARQGKPL